MTEMVKLVGRLQGRNCLRENLVTLQSVRTTKACELFSLFGYTVYAPLYFLSHS